jgi:hypothetical protein
VSPHDIPIQVSGELGERHATDRTATTRRVREVQKPSGEAGGLQHPYYPPHDLVMRTSTILVSALGLAGTALGQSCPEASRFGNSVVTASSTKPLVAGDVRTLPLRDVRLADTHAHMYRRSRS